MNIFDYIDPAAYLKDHLKEVKQRNSAFSLRAWAYQLGMKSHGPLHAILNNQRNIPKKLVPTLIKSLKLEAKNAEYFEVLVDLQRSKSSDERELYLEKLEKLSPTPLREIEDIEAYKVITDPTHIILGELTQLKEFSSASGWIKQRLRPSINMKELEEAYERLLKLGIIKEQRGRCIKSVEHIYTKYEIESKTIQAYHKYCAMLAIDEIAKQPIEQREYNAIALNIKTKNLPKIKEKIREFVNELVDEFEAKPHQGDETYQLNTQFFALTK